MESGSIVVEEKRRRYGRRYISRNPAVLTYGKINFVFVEAL